MFYICYMLFTAYFYYSELAILCQPFRCIWAAVITQNSVVFWQHLHASQNVPNQLVDLLLIRLVCLASLVNLL